MITNPWAGESGPVTRPPAERGWLPLLGSALRPALRLWELAGLGAVLAVAGVLNVSRLDQEGYANTYYAATVRSMLQSWHNFFFASFDPGGFVTVDKPALGFWIQAASAKLFGFHGWSLLLPEALAGVLSVAVLFILVRRSFGPVAGLIAALGLALTPVAVAVNRNNTIDSLLVLTVLLAAWAALRAAEGGRLRWLLLSMALVGLGFNIKMMQAYLVLPALLLLYLVAAPHGLLKRAWHLALAGVVVVAVSFAWIVAVDLTPAADRPYVGSSQHNSELELALGYNGLERLLGRGSARLGGVSRPDGTAPTGAPRTGGGSPVDDGARTGTGGATAFPGAGARVSGAGGFPGGPGGGGPGGNGENGAAGPLRLINAQLGGQAGWLLVPALLGIAAGVWQMGWWRRRDPRWQSILLWAAWLAPAAAFFSVAGYFHSYYLVMLAPPIAALAAIGFVTLFRAGRRGGWRSLLLPAALLATAGLQLYLLRPYPDWSHRLTPFVVGLAATAAALLVVSVRRHRSPLSAAVRGGALALGVGAALIVPAAWSATTARAAGGALPHGGPSASIGFGRGARPAQGFRPVDGDGRSGARDGGLPAPAGDGAQARPAGGIPAGLPPAGFSGRGGPGEQVNQALLDYLETNRGGDRFLLATSNEGTAASIILQTGEPVMAMGGFLGSDPILTPETLAQDVANGTVRYFLVGGFGPGGPGASELTSWIRANGTPVPASEWGGVTGAGGFGGMQLYEVTGAGSGQ